MTRRTWLTVAVFAALILANVAVVAALWATVRRDVRQSEQPKPAGWRVIHLDSGSWSNQWPDVATFCDHGNRVYVPDVRNGDPSIAVVADPTCPHG